LLLHGPHGGRLTFDSDGAPAAATPVRPPQSGRYRCGERAVVQCPMASHASWMAPPVRRGPPGGGTRGPLGAPPAAKLVSPRGAPRYSRGAGDCAVAYGLGL